LILIYGALAVLSSLFADIAQLAVDPRAREAAEASA
jgi:ABC-type dipeptide/oligopeptide/nickel transport system permease component